MEWRQVKRLVAWAALVVGSLAAVAWAAEPSTEQRLNQLEDLVKKQSERIHELEEAEQGTTVNERKQEQIRQMIVDIMADMKKKGSFGGGINAGYDKGFYIRTDDETFSLKFNNLMQFRYTGLVNNPKNDTNITVGKNKVSETVPNDRNDFQIKHTELSLSGNIINKNLTYLVMTELNTDNQNTVKLKDWYIDYKIDTALVLRAGQYKVPQGMQQLTSTSELQFVDRSLATEGFQLGRAIGVEAYGTVLEQVRKDFLNYSIGVFNGFDNRDSVVSSDTTTKQNDTNLAFASRAEFVLFGDDNAYKELKDEPDLLKIQTPAMKTGFCYAFDDINVPEGGYFNKLAIANVTGQGVSKIDMTDVDVQQFSWDTRFKWNGFSTSAEYFLRGYTFNGNKKLDYPTVTGSSGPNTLQGGYLQSGYYFGDKLPIEPVVRVGGIWDNGESGNTWEVAGGLNWYIKGHNLKLQTDVTRIAEVPVTSADAGFVPNQDITMIRTQLSLKF